MERTQAFEGRRRFWKFFALWLILWQLVFPVLLAFNVVGAFGLVREHDSVGLFYYLNPLLPLWLLILFVYDALYDLFFAFHSYGVWRLAAVLLFSAVPVLQLVGWLLANAGKRSGSRIIKVCSVLQIIAAALVMVFFFAVILMAVASLPMLVLPILFSILFPALLLHALGAWEPA